MHRNIYTAGGDILLSSNRDENPFRARALAPQVITSAESKLICPIDGLAGGTWSGMNEFGDIIILLNGGFEKHIHTGNYAKSRGLIVRELLSRKFSIDIGML